MGKRFLGATWDRALDLKKNIAHFVPYNFVFLFFFVIDFNLFIFKELKKIKIKNIVGYRQNIPVNMSKKIDIKLDNFETLLI